MTKLRRDEEVSLAILSKICKTDQRGCGRTYYKNKELDSQNETASFEQALKDVDALVDYRFSFGDKLCSCTS